jgi:hypothetical protein
MSDAALNLFVFETDTYILAFQAIKLILKEEFPALVNKTLRTYKKKSSFRLSVWVNNQVEPASIQPTKKLLEESVATTDFIKVEI